ncbi:class I SAM-dependent methyltransferase [Gleimia sp. 6138-11-ORH1]|uniref:class I SAM-dependent methyltransferase n=1 Tax=Gleimia sp. 6138-11-ORH1 TaxID=2973937 RepID=UPI0021699EC5|nr:class I SAM-dependent methyltransferase [Gleimia sp. 6138-11-ORH1]MCS4485042.1 class I SAM-dependent methyltransferase [Gleimia sp. 6138-11-ORH1]
MKENPWAQAAPRNAFELATGEYAQLRPAYPFSSVLAALLGDTEIPEGATSTNWQISDLQHEKLASLEVADIGAGTGIFTAQAAPLVKQIVAVEPAEAMRIQCETHLAQTHPTLSNWSVTRGSGENTGLETASQDVLVFAQCWHWMNVEKTVQEAARVLRAGGHLAIIFNQLDVSVPWVKRLARIMRSGDVQTAERPPELTANYHAGQGSYPQGKSEELFKKPKLHQVKFQTQLSCEQIIGLARTRSAYLKATPQYQARMQENLRWYLYEHLGYSPTQKVSIPYYTLTWIANK